LVAHVRKLRRGKVLAWGGQKETSGPVGKGGKFEKTRKESKTKAKKII